MEVSHFNFSENFIVLDIPMVAYLKKTHPVYYTLFSTNNIYNDGEPDISSSTQLIIIRERLQVKRKAIHHTVTAARRHSVKGMSSYVACVTSLYEHSGAFVVCTVYSMGIVISSYRTDHVKQLSLPQARLMCKRTAELTTGL